MYDGADGVGFRRLSTALATVLVAAALVVASPSSAKAEAVADEPGARVDTSDPSVSPESMVSHSAGRARIPRPAIGRSTCAGIRGNGQNLFAHYGALARHVEEYGAITCAAGGSSGSITTFLLESMWANPDLHRCGRWRCRPVERDARLSLMLKSVVGLTDAGLFRDAEVIGALAARVEQEGIPALLEGPEPAEGVEAFRRLVRDLGPLVNPELFDLLADSPDPVFHVTDIIDGLQKGVNFQVDDPKVFLRTSVVDFDRFASLIGSFGSFYAAYGPADRATFSAWLDTCAAQGVGATWAEVAAMPGPGGVTCGAAFTDLFDRYREAFASGDAPNRADDRVGRYLPVFGVTGVLKGDAIDRWRLARAAWLEARPVGFEPDFDDIGVGYWGRENELRRMQRRLDRRYDDLVSEQFTRLGRPAWREVLASSPAEPGFSPGVPLSSGFVSVGGWADPLRVTALDAAGARTVIAINRLGGVGGFTADVTRLLNADDEDLAELYSTTDPESSFYVALDVADGVWCTDWDGQAGDPNRLFDDAYRSPLITDVRRLLRPRNGYPNVGDDVRIGGCVPGLPVG